MPRNEDLIGFKWTDGAGEEVEVVSLCDWSANYVTVRFPTGHETIKPVVAVRQRKEADRG